jgi:hypothetical protein
MKQNLSAREYWFDETPLLLFDELRDSMHHVKPVPNQYFPVRLPRNRFGEIPSIEMKVLYTCGLPAALLLQPT